MAVMIPPLIQEGTRSPGERELFFRLRDDPATTDWVVLHSLDIARHVRQRNGEADFVIIVPKLGVLVLEVKAHSHVRRDNGLWLFGIAGQQADARGPFRQAAEAMQSVRTRVSTRSPDLSRVVFWSGVVFTSIDFRIHSEEWHDWQVIDAQRLRSRPISRLLVEMLERGRAHLAHAPSASWFDASSKEPTAAQCRLLSQLLRPDFEAFESPSARAQNRHDELKRYTAEQFGALDAMTSNPRVVFEGPAGTGKTLLAVEAARRARADGRRVLLLCFNRMLGAWLERETSSLRPGVQAGTLHKYLLSLAPQPTAASDLPTSFWEQELPSKAVDHLLATPASEVFDEIIIDEAQDILHSAFLDVLDLSLRGGLAAGRWRLFGDFEGQTIYRGQHGASIALLERRTGAVTRFSLRVNCRNTPRIAELVHALGRLVPPYSRVLRPDDGIDPEIRYYADASEQVDMLARALQELEREGFRGGDVVILSTRAQTACAAALTMPPWSDRLRPTDPIAVGFTSYCSIYAFKGMEAPAVIVTDVDHLAGEDAAALFYVATTRALCRLVILAHQRVRTEARALVEQHLAQI